jgi:glycosyltransferase involved in cell wall biosynthesis
MGLGMYKKLNREVEVSVIIPVYNSENTIIKAIDSIKNQTYKGKMEIILINDGSKDNSLCVIKEYIKNFSAENIEIRIINQENKGASAARNRGLREAKGKYIALLDSDDEWLENKLEKQLEILEKNREIDFLGCNRNGEQTKILFKIYKELKKIELKHLLIKVMPATPCAIFKRDILEDVGYYDETQRYSEDANYWMKICAAGKNFYMMPESLVITGAGKPHFGFSGLSSNLVGMHEGTLKNLRDMLKINAISRGEYLFFNIFYHLKYFRRILIVGLRKWKYQ